MGPAKVDACRRKRRSITLAPPGRAAAIHLLAVPFPSPGIDLPLRCGVLYRHNARYAAVRTKRKPGIRALPAKRC